MAACSRAGKSFKRKKMLASMACMPYLFFMKMTMHIDEDILAHVVKITGVASKTKAVEVALTELVRRHRFKELAGKGLGLSPEELKNAWEDPFPQESLKAAEESVKYGRKRSRR
jgi:Arc/MetJ family transcription regulator